MTVSQDTSDRGTRNILALSGGKDSTAMLLRLLELGEDVTCVYTPTGDELPPVKQHIEGLAARVAIVQIGLPGGLKRLIREQKMLPNWRARLCTRMLKIAPFQAWLCEQRPCTVFVGLRADEQGRAGVEYGWSDVAVRYPLREWGWDIGDVLGYLDAQGVTIPGRTDRARCFFQTLHEWYMLWRDYREIYLDAEADEAVVGHTYRSPQRDTHPAELYKLRMEFEQGYVPKQRERKIMCRFCSM